MSIPSRPRMRTIVQPVRLTEAERERIDALIAVFGCTCSDVLRAGIGALEREQATEARREGKRKK